MSVSYKPLWKLMIDKGINKTQLCKEAGIVTKLENVLPLCERLK